MCCGTNKSNVHTNYKHIQTHARTPVVDFTDITAYRDTSSSGAVVGTLASRVATLGPA